MARTSKPARRAASAPAATPSARHACSAKLPLAAPAERSACTGRPGTKHALTASKRGRPPDLRMQVHDRAPAAGHRQRGRRRACGPARRRCRPAASSAMHVDGADALRAARVDDDGVGDHLDARLAHALGQLARRRRGARRRPPRPRCPQRRGASAVRYALSLLVNTTARLPGAHAVAVDDRWTRPRPASRPAGRCCRRPAGARWRRSPARPASRARATRARAAPCARPAADDRCGARRWSGSCGRGSRTRCCAAAAAPRASPAAAATVCATHAIGVAPSIAPSAAGSAVTAATSRCDSRLPPNSHCSSARMTRAPALPAGQRRGESGGPAAHDQHVAVGVHLVVAVGIRLDRARCRGRDALRMKCSYFIQNDLRPHERLVVEAGRHEAREAAR